MDQTEASYAKKPQELKGNKQIEKCKKIEKDEKINSIWRCLFALFADDPKTNLLWSDATLNKKIKLKYSQLTNVPNKGTVSAAWFQ